MRKVNETNKVKTFLKKRRLRKQYDKQKALFIDDPSHPSLDFIMTDRKHKICSFKVNNQYRVKIIKHPDDSYTVIDAGDFHKKQ